MAKTDLLSCLLEPHVYGLTPSEKILLEIKLLIQIYQELSAIFKLRYQRYLILIKSQKNQEDEMTEIKFIQEMIKDILATEEYTLRGISVYTNIPEDLLFDVLAGINAYPSFEVSKKIIELHMSVRRHLYDDIMFKIASEYIVQRDNMVMA